MKNQTKRETDDDPEMTQLLSRLATAVERIKQMERAAKTKTADKRNVQVAMGAE